MRSAGGAESLNEKGGKRKIVGHWATASWKGSEKTVDEYACGGGRAG